MIQWFNKIFGYRYWYQVKYQYRVKGKRIFAWHDEIGLIQKSTILNLRKCNKIDKPLHKSGPDIKQYLDNGKISMNVISYIGHLKHYNMNSIKELLTYLTNQFKFWVIIKEWETGLQLRNGRIIRKLNQGIYFKIPFLDNVYAKSKRTQDVVISQVNFTTKDDKQITASAAAFFRIVDIKKYYNGYAEPYSIMDNIIKNEINRYFLRTNYKDFNIKTFESKILFLLKKEVIDKGMLFEDFKLTTFSNARTYRLITDKLYAQTSSYLDDQIY